MSLSYAASALYYGKKVLILDNKNEINLYKEKKLKIFEPNLDKILNKFNSNLKVSSNFKDAKDSDIFLAKDVKTDKNNNTLLKESKNLLKNVALYKKNSIIMVRYQ